ncbi:hypothetical protein V6N11_037484 [Hibiscus sabdariffa]|uniref:Uncharacterized protein n=1 Tax=Hibiscus sabdariffa TaxID=183260 RepID=A0ABR2P1L6_9ROSI
MMVSCQDNFVNELKIRGDKLVDVSGFSGYAIHNKTLSEKFSIDSLVTTLTTDKVNQFKLGGLLPKQITYGSKLGFVDISSNKLVGELPSCLDNKSDKRVEKFGGNCLSIEGQQQNQSSHCKEANTRKTEEIFNSKP